MSIVYIDFNVSRETRKMYNISVSRETFSV